MEKVCKNCKHYVAPRGDDKKDDLGECNCNKFFYDNNELRPLNDKLEYWDYEGYSAGFYVGKNFGCIHFNKLK